MRVQTHTRPHLSGQRGSSPAASRWLSVFSDAPSFTVPPSRPTRPVADVIVGGMQPAQAPGRRKKTGAGSPTRCLYTSHIVQSTCTWTMLRTCGLMLQSLDVRRTARASHLRRPAPCPAIGHVYTCRLCIHPYYACSKYRAPAPALSITPPLQYCTV